MKNIIVFILIVSSFSINAQETEVRSLRNRIIAQPNQIIYYKDINGDYDKFLGTWLYDDGEHYLRIINTKDVHVPYGRFNNAYYDELTVKLVYKHNGQTIYDTTTYTEYNTNAYNGHVIGGTGLFGDNNVSLVYTEPPLGGQCQREMRADLILEYLAPIEFNQAQQLKWTRKDDIMEHWGKMKCPDGSPYDQTPFRIPADLILIKQ